MRVVTVSSHNNFINLNAIGTPGYEKEDVQSLCLGLYTVNGAK